MEDNVSSPVQVQSASKKELLEMHRESEQLIRSAPVAMHVRVNKKFTMGNFLARFQQKLAPVTNESPGRETADSALPTSPSKQETLTSAEPAHRSIEADTSDNLTISSKSLPSRTTNHPLEQTYSNDSDSELELEIVENETTLIKRKRSTAMASLLTGVNRYQTQLTSPEKRGDPSVRRGKTSRFQSPKNNTKESVIPIGVDHRQLNVLLTRRILEQSSRKRLQESALSESALSNDTTTEVEEGKWSGEEGEEEIVDSGAEAEVDHLGSEKASPAIPSPVDDETDGSSDDACELVLPTRQARKLALANSPPPSPGKLAQATVNRPLFPLFSCVKQPVSSFEGGTTSTTTDALLTLGTDATLSITPTTHGLLAQGVDPPSVTTPVGNSEDIPKPSSIIIGKPKAHRSLESNTEWFDEECFTNIPSPSEDSLFDESDLLLHPAVSNSAVHISKGSDPGTLGLSQEIEPDCSQRPLTTLVISDDDISDAIHKPGEGTPVIDGEGSPTQPLTISTTTVPFSLTPTQPLLDEEHSPTPDDACVSLITTNPTVEPSPPPVRLNRLKRRKDMRPEDLPHRKKVATHKPRSTFLDAEAEEAVSDDELEPDEPFGKQLMLDEFNNESAGNPIGSQQSPGASDGEEGDEDGEDLDEWDENDSMIAFSGDEEDGNDPEAVRQLHQQREATDDANAVATLYRDISDGRLLDRSRLRRKQQAGHPGQGDRVDLMDWVEGEDVVVNADQERRRLMWKRGLRLGKAAEQEDDEAHTQLCKLAEHPETAAFARSALALDMIEPPTVPVDVPRGIASAQTDQDTDDDKERDGVVSIDAQSGMEDGEDHPSNTSKRPGRLSSSIARKKFSAIRSGSVGDFRITRKSASQSAFANATPPPASYDPLDFLEKSTQSSLDVSSLLTKRSGIYRSSNLRKITGFNPSASVEQGVLGNLLPASGRDSNSDVSTFHSRNVKKASVKDGPSGTGLDDFSVTRETRLRRFLPEKHSTSFLTSVSLTSSNRSITTFSSTADQTNAAAVGHPVKVKQKFG
ncbi:hypothetical protein IWQ61_008516 [Dispira simplex]|nr:hypothetical protein IWQ61_008516 [Dispira simplex]